MRLVVLATLVGLLGGCTQPRSPRCKEVCKREADCVDTTGNKIPFDEKECVAACSVLEADVADNAAKVTHHYECVSHQQSCASVLECQ